MGIATLIRARGDLGSSRRIEHYQFMFCPYWWVSNSIEIALEDLTLESIGISKVRTLLADVQVRSLHGGPLAESS